jgi:hypothetical protein
MVKLADERTNGQRYETRTIPGRLNVLSEKLPMATHRDTADHTEVRLPMKCNL